MKKKPILYWLGNLLIISSIVGFTFTFLPLIRVYFFPNTLPKDTVDPKYSIFIPKINAKASIVDTVDPWNKKEYLEALKKGIAHAKNTSEPGEKGTMYLFAHSSGMPWELTYINTIFLRLDDLQKGDSIFITKDRKKFKYIVREKKEVWPNEVNYLLSLKKTQLILQTCTPIGTSLKRLLVFADPG